MDDDEENESILRQLEEQMKVLAVHFWKSGNIYSNKMTF